MHTEKQAKELWCPMARVIHTDNSTGQMMVGNSWGDGLRSDASKCIAGGCAMWRWKPYIKPNEVKGYCGLAGQ